MGDTGFEPVRAARVARQVDSAGITAGRTPPPTRLLEWFASWGSRPTPMDRAETLRTVPFGWWVRGVGRRRVRDRGVGVAEEFADRFEAEARLMRSLPKVRLSV